MNSDSVFAPSVPVMAHLERRGAVMTIETLVKLGLVAGGIFILSRIFASVQNTGARFTDAMSRAPWNREGP